MAVYGEEADVRDLVSNIQINQDRPWMYCILWIWRSLTEPTDKVDYERRKY